MYLTILHAKCNSSAKVYVLTRANYSIMLYHGLIGPLEFIQAMYKKVSKDGQEMLQSQAADQS